MNLLLETGVVAPGVLDQVERNSFVPWPSYERSM